jgi:tetratricopeptide (TPR) repeat protein
MNRPADPMALARRIAQLVREDQVSEALMAATGALAQHPNHPMVLRAASEVYSAQGDHAQAVKFAEAAVKGLPNDPGGLLHLSVCQARADREDEAVETAKKAAALVPDNPAVLSHVATMLSRLDENNAAKVLYEKALALNPGNAQDYYNLATVQQFLGDLKGAEESCDRALELNPKLYETHLVRSRLRRQTAERNHVAELEVLRAQGGKAPIEHAVVCYALAKEFEDLGEYERSFAVLKEGADTYRRSITYDVRSDTGHMDALVAAFTPEVCADVGHGFAYDKPIFVLGLPRTGTTLVERIFASHSDVISAGELPNFLQQMRRLTRAAFPNAREEDLIANVLALDPAALGEGYVRSVPGRYKKAGHFVDKLPANFLHVGFIRRALPQATIVELQRHPMDACYAMYKTLFNQIYPATYDLTDLAAYYIHYRKLMDHWHEQFAGKMTTVAYEDVVADQEAQSRRLMTAAGLPWEDQVLEFHKTKSASATASAAQVRSPVYASSVQLWRRYEKELEPLAEHLTKAGIDIS